MTDLHNTGSQGQQGSNTGSNQGSQSGSYDWDKEIGSPETRGDTDSSSDSDDSDR